MADDQTSPSTVGPNAWLVDEMYEQYVADPTSVSESWQEFFHDYRPDGAAAVAPAPAAAPAAAPTGGAAAPAPRRTGRRLATAPSRSSRRASPSAARRRGSPKHGKSLEVPTATSFREVPAKLLEVNRSVINNYLGRTRGGKVSFTHIIGFAVVRAIADDRAGHELDLRRGRRRQAPGHPPRARRPGPGRRRREGRRRRTLLVPCIKDADTLDFRGFLAAYEDLIRKVRTNKLTPDDFAGATVTLTNPGTIGTVQSVPRLMPGQGVIVGVGALDYPTEFQGADPGHAGQPRRVEDHHHHVDLRPPHHPGRRVGPVPQARPRAAAGRRRASTTTSSARSACPYEAVEWRRDVNPVDHEQAMLEKQMRVDR